MPASGGSADKLGNRYEALWAVDQLLGIVDGAVLHLTLEPLDPDQSRGIEFIVAIADGATEYWSVKRQTTKAAGWTLARLAEKDDRGRSILADLLQHVERDATNKGVFASTLGARDFEELREFVESQPIFDTRLDQSGPLKVAYRQHILPLCRGDAERARTFLLRTRTHACDEPQLRDRVHFAIRKLFHMSDGSALDSSTVRHWLADLLLDSIHRPIDRDRILSTLAVHRIRLRDWGERTVRDRIHDLCNGYTEPLQSQLINGTFLPLEGSGRLLDLGNTLPSQKILVVGGAGGGKSSTLASEVGRLRDSSIPVLAIPFDQLPEGLLTTTELGRKLLLPESPALVLAGVAAGKPCVLIIDQLDAVSIASGRRAELWALFDRLHREVERFPNVSLIVGCREFDLEHDHRMRAMKAEASGFVIVELKPLSLEQVDTALQDAEIDLRTVQPTLKPILAVPLHLSMFLSLTAGDRVAVRSRDELFNAFWVQGEHRTDLRLGRKTAWTQVIDSLANRLSETQQLSAPQYVLDDFRADAAAMASEHILVFADGRYRFFHESFFDYAFARRFAARGRRLVDLLLGSEQHLFRRAQARQILAYLRAHDWPRYLEEVASVLLDPGVRFHIKRLVLQWLSSLPDPQNQEWGILDRLLLSAPHLRAHVRALVAGHPGWFDVLDKAGFFDAALSSGDSTREQEVIWMFGFHATLKSRSSRVAALLQKHRKSDQSWRQYLIHIVRTGNVYHAPDMFALFLSLIDDGTLDGVRPGFAVNDDWWSALYSMARERPELACEAIGRWFDRALIGWRSHRDGASASADPGPAEARNLHVYLDRSGDVAAVIHDAANSPLSYVEHLLPRVAALVSETAEERRDRLQRDSLWSFRWFGDSGHEIHDAILSGLTRSLEALAKTAPAKLDHSLVPYRDRPHDTIAYLVLRAWTAAPDFYADQLAEYLATDPRRLKVGYAASGGGGGSPGIYASSQAVRAASTRCSPELFAALEQAIVAVTDYWEARSPSRRGLMQLELLESLDHSRLSPAGRDRLEELRRKFPRIIHEPPRPMQVVTVKSPIAEDAQAKMSDEQWLGAMRKYAGAQGRWDRADGTAGGERELAHSIQQRAKTEPARFAMLAQRMPDNLPASYFDAILLGVTQSPRTDGD